MKRMLFLLLLSSLAAKAQEFTVERAFSLVEVPAVVEGMTYDPVGKNFYFGESLSFRILRYTRSGKPAGFIDAAQDGMTTVLGLSVSPIKRHLWVCGAITVEGRKLMCMFQYSLENGKLINRFPDTSGKAKLFNDVTITANGSVYITDTYSKSLYKVDTANNISTIYLQSDSLINSNGITAVENILYVSTSKGFARVNTADKSISLTNLKDIMIVGNDGLYYYDRSLIAIQNVFFPVTIARYFLDKDGKKITRAIVLTAGHPSFIIPTTGVFVDNDFYFMLNNNIENYDPTGGKELKKDAVKQITVGKIHLVKSTP